MSLPRDISGDELTTLLRRHYGYQLVRQRGSHMRLASNVRGTDHHVTVPRHRHVSVGTLSGIINDVAEYLGSTPAAVRRELFGD